MLYLSREQILSFFTMRDAIEADKKAFVLHTQGKAQVPLRINLETEDKSGQCMFMPAYVGGLNMAGVKMVSFFPSNAEKGIPVVPATVALIDGTTGLVTAILEGTTLGAMAAVAEQEGIPVRRERLLVSDLMAADAVWLLSSVTLAARVRRIDDVMLPTADPVIDVARLADRAVGRA